MVNSATQSQLANIHQSSAVMQNIRDALAAGKSITVHENPISYAGLSGAGYIIIDPSTGSGAYLIEGGGRGALFLIIIAAILAITFFTLLGPLFAGGFGAILAGLAFYFLIKDFFQFFSVVKALGTTSCSNDQVNKILSDYAFTQTIGILSSFLIPYFSTGTGKISEEAKALFDFPIFFSYGKIVEQFADEPDDRLNSCKP